MFNNAYYSGVKKLFYLLAIVLLASCIKDDSTTDDNNNEDNNDTIPKTLGLIENFLLSRPSVVVQRCQLSDIGYDGQHATYRGYIFKPGKNIKITKIGGRIAATGTYPVEIYQLSSSEFSFLKTDTMLVDSISISDISVFQYKDLTTPVILQANQRYVIRYFSEGHFAVYDAGLGYYQSDEINDLAFPLKYLYNAIEGSYFTYHDLFHGEYVMLSEGEFRYGIIRGLVDFKYEVVE
jgi:hypothetical protein